MSLASAIILVGTLAIFAYIANGLLEGRKNRKPLVRDSRTEETAKSLSNTTTDECIHDGAVKIIENNESLSVSNNAVLETVSTKNKNTVTENNESVQETNMANATFMDKLKNFFKNLFVGEQAPKNEVSQNTLPDPDETYQFNIIADEEGESFTACEIAQACEKYHLVKGEHDLYYYMKDEKALFRVCGNKAPYGFADDGLTEVKYQAVLVSMDLPERGNASFVYSEMAKLSYLLVSELGGTIVNNKGEAFGEEMYKKNFAILEHYDGTAL